MKYNFFTSEGQAQKQKLLFNNFALEIKFLKSHKTQACMSVPQGNFFCFFSVLKENDI